MNRGRFDLLGTPIDPLTLQEAVSWIRERARGQAGLGFVHTVNVDHLVLARRIPEFAALSATAELSLADGMPLVWLGRALGHAVPERVTGVDLVTAVGAVTEHPPVRVFLVGGEESVSAAAAAALDAMPGYVVVGRRAPEPSALADPEFTERLAAELTAAGAQLLLVALGAPRQEFWIESVRARLSGGVAIGVGATLDFLAGRSKRAPGWMQRLGLEWLARLAAEPVRLGRRYLIRDAAFVWWALQALVRRWLGGSR